MANVEGKVVLITGAGSGIGKVVAETFAENKAKVMCLDIKGADETAEKLKDSGYDAHAFEMDVTNLEDWKNVKEQVLSHYGKIDVLCNIAGISEAVDIVDLEEADFDKMMNVNLKGPYFGMKVILPEFVKQSSGKIVNIASLAAHVGLTGLPSYSASKGGVIAMTRQVAVEYAPKNIQINAISPGIINTPILANNPPEVTKQFTDATPAGRLGEPKEIANLVVYLSSPEADFITGQAIKVDGGWGSQ